MGTNTKGQQPNQAEEQVSDGPDLKLRLRRGTQLRPIPVLHVLPGAKEAAAAEKLFGRRSPGYIYVEKACTPKNALRALSELQFEIVLLDSSLLEIMDLGFLRRLREAAVPPVVIVSGRPIEDPVSERSIPIGGQYFFVKGEVDEAALLEAVIYTRGRWEMQGELRQLEDDLRRSRHELESAHLQLIQAEKLEALGQLAAGIAHEVKNPLARILLGVEYLDRADLANDKNLPTILDQIKKAARLADNIVHGMVDYSFASELKLENGDLNALVKNAAMMIQHELTLHSVEPKFDLAGDLPRVVVDPAKLEQVLVNLFLNAVHAMKDGPGSQLRISTAAEEIDDLQAEANPPATLGLSRGDLIAVIRIEDEGPGISQDDLPRVFDPFFTTKLAGKGTGLGLAVCQKIIDLHQGQICIENRRHQAGARVTIKLPLAVGAAG